MKSISIGCAVVCLVGAQLLAWEGSRVLAWSPPRQAASSFLLPDSVFSPATVTQRTVPLSNQDASDSKFWPGLFHGTKVSDLGRVTGMLQRADWKPDGATNMDFLYAASVFANAGNVQRAWQDASTFYLKYSNVSSASCSSGITVPCARLTVRPAPAQNINIDQWYDVMQVNQCLVETSFYTPSSLFDTYGGQMEQTLAAIDQAALNVAQVACGSQPPPGPTTVPTPVTGPVAFTIISARLEHYKAKPDWKQVRPPLSQIKRGRKVQLSLYFVVTSAAPNQSFIVHWTVRNAGRTVVNKDYSSHLNATPDQKWRDWVGPFTLRSTGSYSITGAITMGGVVHQAQQQFSVIRKRPAAAAPVSFTFMRLAILNKAGHPQRSLRANQPVGVSYTFFVRNVRGTVRLVVIRSYRRYAGRQGWVPIGHPVPEYSDTSGGSHTITVYSVPNPLYVRQQVLVGINIGGSHAERAITFSLHP